MKKKKRKKKKKNPLRSNLQTIQGPPLDCKSYTVFFCTRFANEVQKHVDTVVILLSNYFFSLVNSLPAKYYLKVSIRTWSTHFSPLANVMETEETEYFI